MAKPAELTGGNNKGAENRTHGSKEPERERSLSQA
jgi:hypothetical protein